MPFNIRDYCDTTNKQINRAHLAATTPSGHVDHVPQLRTLHDTWKYLDCPIPHSSDQRNTAAPIITHLLTTSIRVIARQIHSKLSAAKAARQSNPICEHGTRNAGQCMSRGLFRAWISPGSHCKRRRETSWLCRMATLGWGINMASLGDRGRDWWVWGR